MHKFIKTLLLISIISFTSCKNEEFFTVGSEWIDSGFDVVLVDTLSVKLSTVKGDSISTKQKNIIWFGHYSDVNPNNSKPLTGVITAKSYMEITKPTKDYDIPLNAIYDSLVLQVKFNGQYMGDTIAKQHLLVYRLAEKMETEEDVYNYYNTTSFKTEDEPIADVIFDNYPYTLSQKTDIRGDAVEPLRIRLPDELGEEFLNKLYDKSPEFDSDDKFVEYFKGLVFVPGDKSNALTAFNADTTFSIKLHYHIMEEVKKEYVVVFNINSTQQFNSMMADRGDTKLNKFTVREPEIPSEVTDNLAFIQSGDVLYTKIEFPSLNQIKNFSKHNTVSKAYLIISPVRNTYSYLTPLPRQLSLRATNTAGSTFELKDSQNRSQNGNLIINEQFQDKTSYSFDITSFINSQVNLSEDQRSYLSLHLNGNDLSQTMQRLVIGDQDQVSVIEGFSFYNRVVLRIEYVSYN